MWQAMVPHVSNQVEGNVAGGVDYDDFLTEVNGLAGTGIKPGPKCGFKLVIDQIRAEAPEVADAVAAAADNPAIYATQLATSLGKRGFSIRSRTILRHRRRLEFGADGCACER